jgi:hypothetical protein
MQRDPAYLHAATVFAEGVKGLQDPATLDLCHQLLNIKIQVAGRRELTISRSGTTYQLAGTRSGETPNLLRREVKLIASSWITHQTRD